MTKACRSRLMSKRIDEETVSSVSKFIIRRYPYRINDIIVRYSDIVDIDLEYLSLKDAIRGLLSMGYTVKDIV